MTVNWKILVFLALVVFFASGAVVLAQDDSLSSDSGTISVISGGQVSYTEVSTGSGPVGGCTPINTHYLKIQSVDTYKNISVIGMSINTGSDGYILSGSGVFNLTLSGVKRAEGTVSVSRFASGWAFVTFYFTSFNMSGLSGTQSFVLNWPATAGITGGTGKYASLPGTGTQYYFSSSYCGGTVWPTEVDSVVTYTSTFKNTWTRQTSGYGQLLTLNRVVDGVGSGSRTQILTPSGLALDETNTTGGSSSALVFDKPILVINRFTGLLTPQNYTVLNFFGTLTPTTISMNPSAPQILQNTQFTLTYPFSSVFGTLGGIYWFKSAPTNDPDRPKLELPCGSDTGTAWDWYSYVGGAWKKYNSVTEAFDISSSLAAATSVTTSFAANDTNWIRAYTIATDGSLIDNRQLNFTVSGIGSKVPLMVTAKDYYSGVAINNFGVKIFNVFSGTWQNSTVSNGFGYYSVGAGVQYKITINSSGYSDKTFNVLMPPTGTYELKAELVPNSILLNVQDSTDGSFIQNAQIGIQDPQHGNVWRNTTTATGAAYYIDSGPNHEYPLVLGYNYTFAGSASGYLPNQKTVQYMMEGQYVTLALSPNATAANGTFNLIVQVNDALTTKSLSGASVVITGGSSAFTNVAGAVILSVPVGSYKLTIAKTGYQSQTAQVTGSSGQTITQSINLLPVGATPTPVGWTPSPTGSATQSANDKAAAGINSWLDNAMAVFWIVIGIIVLRLLHII